MPTYIQFKNALKTARLEAPFSVLDKQVAESTGNFSYPLRRSTMPTTVKLYQPILEAVRMYARSENTPMDTPYIMVAYKASKAPKGSPMYYAAEIQQPDGSTIVVHQCGCYLRISQVDANDPNDIRPLMAYDRQTSLQLAAQMLTILPDLLKIDDKEAGGKIGAVIKALGAELETASGWTSKDEVPDIVKEHLYYLDACISVLDKMVFSFGSPTSSSPDEISYSELSQSGALVCENRVNGWTPRFVTANGEVYTQTTKHLTVGDAKKKFAGFSAHRTWTPMETMLIPQFPDDMPVMPEVVRMANRIVDTRNDTNPVCNLMWRSSTGYGKSTGTRQLAAILNMPYLSLTCHPSMEVQEFKSNFVPSTADGIELDMSGVSVPAANEEQKERPPFFAEAMAHIAAIDEAERNDLLDAKKFFCNVMVEDTDTLAKLVIGTEQTISCEELCCLYSEVRSAFLHENPLKKQIQQLQATTAHSEDKGNKPEFVHVVSNYVKAMVNGYIIEIQEASRIRDSGVLVGLNEFDRPGAVIPLMNGALARRHKDAICVITDNVGYASCRPIDPSVLRRQSLIIDSAELTEEQLLERVRSNTKVADETLLKRAYQSWRTVKEYCQQNSITEGSVSPVELERFVQALMYDGMDCFEQDLDDCVISKASSSVDDQRDIRSACITSGAATK